MKGHEFQSGSHLQNWIEHELSHLAAHEQEEMITTDMADRNLSLRIPLAIHLMLSRIAEKLGRSKSAVSEEVLTRAVRDVYQQFGLPNPTRAEVEEFASDHEITSGKKPA